jgi:hypothetical protein
VGYPELTPLGLGKLGSHVGEATAKIPEDVVVAAADTNVPVANSKAPIPERYIIVK